jgi:hypothetical protein
MIGSPAILALTTSGIVRKDMSFLTALSKKIP